MFLYLFPLAPPSLPPSLSHPSRWSQSTELISLYYGAASHQLSILRLVVYIRPCHSLTLSQLTLTGIKTQTYQRMDLRIWGGGRVSWSLILKAPLKPKMTGFSFQVSQFPVVLQVYQRLESIRSVFIARSVTYSENNNKENDTNKVDFYRACFCYRIENYFPCIILSYYLFCQHDINVEIKWVGMQRHKKKNSV